MPFNVIEQLKYYKVQGVFKLESSKRAMQRGQPIFYLQRSLGISQAIQAWQNGRESAARANITGKEVEAWKQY